ncbi:MAG: phosphatidate cytidylyltransferase [Bacilli bacterium]|nr:phosphatidate cytidylyltransferase [Bacilli bacterium]
MKTRVISAIVALLIFIPIFIIGGNLFNFAIFVLALLGLKEFLAVKNSKKELPIFIKLVSYIMLTFLLFAATATKEFTYGLDFRVIAGIFLVYLIPAVLYHDRKLYSINDAFYLVGGIFFLGISFHILMYIRSIGVAILLYLFCISVFTDTFAYITGLLIGKHKLLESISPKKTIEGMVGGTLMGVLISTWFYMTVVDTSAALFSIIVVTLFLSILGQLGDLVFSAIKRYYKTKDFSNIMPGHGGILDRFDSIIFILLGFMFFMTII